MKVWIAQDYTYAWEENGVSTPILGIFSTQEKAVECLDAWQGMITPVATWVMLNALFSMEVQS